MPYKKGKSGNVKGKPKGVKSKKTIILEAFVQAIAEGGVEKFQIELNKLTGKDYVTSYLALLEYVKPKLARQEVKQEGSTTQTIKVEFV
jgi:hypothetical protein